MIWFILTLAILLIWAIPAFRTLQKMDKQSAPLWRIPFAHLIDEPEEAAVVFFLLGIIFAVGGYVTLHGWGSLRDIVGDFYANIAMECISIAITVLIIERLYERRSKAEAEKAEKERLILQMGSPDNTIAIEAVRQLRQRGWLTDGSLVGANLKQANLKGANLMYANLQGAELVGATLEWANLMYSTLNGASLTYADLTNTYLNGANMSYVRMTDANLSYADLSDTNLYGANLRFVNLYGARLNKANLACAKVGAININEANLQQARYDRETRWIGDIDPKAAGAIEVRWHSGSLEWIPVD